MVSAFATVLQWWKLVWWLGARQCQATTLYEIQCSCPLCMPQCTEATFFSSVFIWWWQSNINRVFEHHSNILIPQTLTCNRTLLGFYEPSFLCMTRYLCCSLYVYHQWTDNINLCLSICFRYYNKWVYVWNYCSIHTQCVGRKTS